MTPSPNKHKLGKEAEAQAGGNSSLGATGAGAGAWFRSLSDAPTDTTTTTNAGDKAGAKACSVADTGASSDVKAGAGDKAGAGGKTGAKACSVADSISKSPARTSPGVGGKTCVEAKTVKGTSAGASGRSSTQMRAKRIAICGLLIGLALIFSYIEAILPFNVGIPGVKLGVANLVVLIALYRLNAKYALAINIVRIVIVVFLFSGVFGILYSLAGGLLSFAIIILLKHSDKFSLIGISIAGGVAHNLGQMLTATLIVENSAVFVYFPVLIFSGLGFGAAIGILAYIILNKLPHSKPQS